MSKTSKNAGGNTTSQTLTLGDTPQTKSEAVREPKRPPRIPMGQGMNLDTTGLELDRENFAYRYFYEDPNKGGRIARAQAAYWEFVVDTDGNQVTHPSGEGVLKLMRLPIEYYDEDQELKRQRVRATLDQEAGIGSGQYVPDGKSAVITREFS